MKFRQHLSIFFLSSLFTFNLSASSSNDIFEYIREKELPSKITTWDKVIEECRDDLQLLALSNHLYKIGQHKDSKSACYKSIQLSKDPLIAFQKLSFVKLYYPEMEKYSYEKAVSLISVTETFNAITSFINYFKRFNTSKEIPENIQLKVLEFIKSHPLNEVIKEIQELNEAGIEYKTIRSFFQRRPKVIEEISKLESFFKENKKENFKDTQGILKLNNSNVEKDLGSNILITFSISQNSKKELNNDSGSTHSVGKPSSPSEFHKKALELSQKILKEQSDLGCTVKLFKLLYEHASISKKNVKSDQIFKFITSELPKDVYLENEPLKYLKIYTYHYGQKGEKTKFPFEEKHILSELLSKSGEKGKKFAESYIDMHHLDQFKILHEETHYNSNEDSGKKLFSTSKILAENITIEAQTIQMINHSK